MRKLATFTLLGCGAVWLTLIAATLVWLRSEALNPSPRDAAIAGPVENDVVPGAAGQRLSPREIVRDHFAWCMGLGLALGLLTYFPVALFGWLVLTRPLRRTTNIGQEGAYSVSPRDKTSSASRN